MPNVSAVPGHTLPALFGTEKQNLLVFETATISKCLTCLSYKVHGSTISRILGRRGAKVTCKCMFKNSLIEY